MQFRTRGRAVQLVRNTLDEKTQRNKSEVVGRLDLPALQPSDELKAKLTPEEREEMATFRKETLQREAITRAYAAMRLAETLTAAADWLSSAEEQEAARFIESIKRPMLQLRRAINARAPGKTA
jgi:hypothetical protein